MRIDRVLCACALLFCSLGGRAQQMSPSTSSSANKQPRVAYYVDTAVLNAGALLADPPAADSAANKAELATLHRIQEARTPELAASAKADEDEEDIFVFKSVLGPQFTPDALSLTAMLGAHVKNEQGVVGSMLKRSFQRPRPYQTDNTLHPVCEVKTTHDSYPSGHSLTGYLEALTLAELVPEKRNEILLRADEYAHNRLVCGVHYPSDIEASRRVAYVMFGYMLASPKFQHDLEASRLEIHTKLSLGGK